MDDIFIALGSNVGQRRHQLIRAIRHLQRLGTIQQISPLYQTSPYGGVSQPDFLNAVVRFTSQQEPLPLLRALKEIEKALGRQHRIRWGPREIDLDIILYGARMWESPELTIPHPDFANRRFVLQPLFSLAPEAVDPRSGKTIRQLLSECRDNTRVTLIAKDWYSDELEI